MVAGTLVFHCHPARVPCLYSFLGPSSLYSFVAAFTVKQHACGRGNMWCTAVLSVSKWLTTAMQVISRARRAVAELSNLSGEELPWCTHLNTLLS